MALLATILGLVLTFNNFETVEVPPLKDPLSF
jgi:hypothetical protein